jgi:hypothetical protein
MNIISFGEKIEGYDYKVINERDARASAGIMLVLGMISLFILFLTQNLFWAEVFTITFIIEFFIRVFINPKYAPYMVLGSLLVINQTPDWVDAKPKKFAWVLGLIIGGVMTYFIIFNILSPIRLLTCLLCLFLFFSEAALGICWGCLIYKKFNKPLNNCPGGICEIKEKNPERNTKLLLVLVFAVMFVFVHYGLKTYKYTSQIDKDVAEMMQDDDEVTENVEAKDSSECQAPQWAIDIGHREKWKEHNCQ